MSRDESKLSLSELELHNGRAALSSLSIDELSMDAQLDLSGGMAMWRSGGAILVVRGTLWLWRVVLEGNQAAYMGGALAIDKGEVSADETVWRHNDAGVSSSSSTGHAIGGAIAGHTLLQEDVFGPEFTSDMAMAPGTETTEVLNRLRPLSGLRTVTRVCGSNILGRNWRKSP